MPIVTLYVPFPGKNTNISIYPTGPARLYMHAIFRKKIFNDFQEEQTSLTLNHLQAGMPPTIYLPKEKGRKGLPVRQIFLLVLLPAKFVYSRMSRHTIKFHILLARIGIPYFSFEILNVFKFYPATFTRWGLSQKTNL